MVVWRVVGRGYWLPFGLFGLIILGAIGLYHDPSCLPGPSSCGSHLGGFALHFLYTGLTPTFDPRTSIVLYWIIALPLGFLAVTTFFLLRSRESGSGVRSIPSVVTGVAILAVLALTSPGDDWEWMPKILLPPNLTVRGLVAILIIGISLLVFAWSERNLTLGFISALFVVVGFVVNLYDVSNVSGVIANSYSAPNLILPGGFLALCAGGLGLAELPRRASSQISEPPT